MTAFGLASNFAAFIYFLIRFNNYNFDLSPGRFISRRVGRIGDITIPSFMREKVYNMYMKIYNVNKEEILDQNLENYKTIKEFFIRKIDVR